MTTKSPSRRRPQGAALIVALAVLPVAGASVPATAHGDEDHGTAPPPPSTAGDVRTASATTSAVELVLRWPARPASAGPLRFRALFSDYATNAPIEGAALEASLSAPGKPDVPLPLKATSSPGIYEGDVTLSADGMYALSMTVVAGELVDVIAVSSIEIGPPPAAAEAPHEHGIGVGRLLVIGSLALLAIITLVFVIRRRQRTKRAVATVSAAILLVAVGARAHGGEDHGDAPAAAAPGPKLGTGRTFLAKESQFLLGVRTKLVEERPIAERVSVPGVITAPPERHAAVFVPQSGRIAPPRGGFPQLGAPIRRGQLLGVVEAIMSASDRASFLSEEARGRADVSASSARLEAARKNLARLESLSGVASKQEVEAARVEVTTAEAEVEAARARIGAFATSGKGGTARFDLVSPLDGVLADINVSPGEVLNEGERAFLVIDPTVLTVEAKVPEHELARLADSGDAMVQVDAFPNRSFPGKLLAEGQVIDEATRTAKVIFTVDNAAGVLKLGMFAQVQIGAGADKAALVVPDAAILDVDGRRVVYVHAAPEEFEERELQIGRRDGELVEVVRGLVAGDRVVVVGGYTLRSAAR